MLDVFTSSVMMTNTVAIKAAGEAILVDPAWTTAELGRLAVHLQEVNIVCGWATHAHHDHVLWHPGFGDVPRYATPRAARRALERQAELQQEATAHVAWELIPLVARVEVFNGRVLPWEGPEVQIVSHNGHSPGHGALWIPEIKTLIAGDMLSDVEIPMFEDTGLQAYRDGLGVLEPYVRDAAEVIPGHGRRTSAARSADDTPVARWEADMAYLEQAASGGGHDDPRISGGPAWLWDSHHANIRSAQLA